ncbi:formate dehydrogenase accessory sulfurtransferase FdhD [Colwellia sp. MEBiC06753]
MKSVAQSSSQLAKKVMKKHVTEAKPNSKEAAADTQLWQLTKASLDDIASEQPLQIWLHWLDNAQQQKQQQNQQGWQRKSLAVIMRTPGQDQALVLGYLLTQGVITSIADVAKLTMDEENVAEVTLDASITPDWSALSRVFASHSGCGVCGQSQLKLLANRYQAFSPEPPWLSSGQIIQMPALLANAQPLFQRTGGSHGAAIWQAGKLRFIAEDVGRHNAVDKVIGQQLQSQQDLQQCVLVLSGRISFELVQKAVVAGINTIVAVGAPSDLAIKTAQQFNQTLIGFVKTNQANIYCGEYRIKVMQVNDEL